MNIAWKEMMLSTVQALEEHVTLPLVPSFVGPLPLTIPPGKLLPSISQAPIVELKSLLEHLKYAFLGDGETLSVIISSKLSEEREKNLIEVLKEHKEVIGWIIADIRELAQPLACNGFCWRMMQSPCDSLKGRDSETSPIRYDFSNF